MRDPKAGSPGDLSIAGPMLAGEAFAGGLVDEVHLFLLPITIGSGKAVMPRDGVHRLRLTDTARYEDGTVRLSYRVIN